MHISFCRHCNVIDNSVDIRVDNSVDIIAIVSNPNLNLCGTFARHIFRTLYVI
ncbi:hypothetical protein HMPREF1579_01144 [Gardnerella vaginalis JCP8066]|nr:hypothetical protein HMPREF1579_01144 [Gardnerella vaginalis JCP8066]